tara:strand:+ start:527 stop:862 length:336 start_codon:yes stop_codon:yes gene_type:complete
VLIFTIRKHVKNGLVDTQKAIANEYLDVRNIVARGGNDNIMKPIMITLMYLTFGGDIKLDTFEIHDTCSGWFHNNVKIVENKKRTLFSSHVYHEYKGKKVIGYVCGGDEPR